MMRIALAMLALLLLLPEIPRYAGERALLRARGSRNADAVRTYPGDTRPLVAAATASYAARDYARAAELFERANAMGERPEIDVNLALAYAHLGQRDRASALLARGVALAPALQKELEAKGIIRKRP